MKITDIRTAEVFGHGYSTYVRVYSDAGIYGTGECIHGGDGCPLIVQEMKRSLIGEDPLDVERHFEVLRRRYIFDGAIGGHAVTAMAGIEIALWDLAGKALGVPVYRLLGGKFRDRIRLYCDCGLGKHEAPPEACAEKATSVVALGFNAIKFDIDDLAHPAKLDQYNHTISPAELEGMAAKVAAVREAIGPHVDFAVDMHGRYDTTSGTQVAQALEPYHLMWLEEPVPPENVAALRRVRESSPIPICAGENLYLRWGFRDLIEQQAVDIIMPDLPKCCGLAEGRKIASLAEMYYIPVAPHNVSGPLGTLASAHACAAIPNFLVLEWHWLGREHWETLLELDEPLLQHGYLALPDRPGLGAEVIEEEAVRHLRPGTQLFPVT